MEFYEKTLYDADLTLLGMTEFTACNNKNWSDVDLTKPQTTKTLFGR